MIWRVRYSKLGGHFHCRLFAAKLPNQTFSKCGDFTVREDELESLIAAFSGAQFLKDES